MDDKGMSMKKNKGFTHIPHVALDSLLVLGLNKREVNTILLIIRLTYGCHRTWARLIQADLEVVGVGSSHAKETLAALLSKTLILQNAKTKEFKLNEEILASILTETVSFRLDKLAHLIGRNLPRKTSQNGNTNVTEMVSSKLPKQEVSSSQNSNIDSLPKQENLASENPTSAESKDIVKEKIINTVKESNGNKNSSNKEKTQGNTNPLPDSKPKGFTTPGQLLDPSRFSIGKGSAKTEPLERYPYGLDPGTFEPTSSIEAEALRTWKRLEPDKPNSFRPTYLQAIIWGLPEGKFGEFASDIEQDPKAINRGALFLTKALKWRNENEKKK